MNEAKDWVFKKDSAYKWELKDKEEKGDFCIFLIELTSQCWRSLDEVNNPIWTHFLKVIVPKNVTTHSAFFFISGKGAFGYKEVNRVSPFLFHWAKKSASVVCELNLMPSKLVHFKDEKFAKEQEEHQVEDHLIAYTWDKYLHSGDKSWPLQMPMTKAVIKALDCVGEFSNQYLPEKIEHFVVAGLSKRGWVSWLVAAHDPRVIGVMPMVVDVLNLRESFSHQLEVYGKWARVVKDYQEIDLIKWAYTEEFSNLLRLIEPYEYRKQIKVPKYMINATGDEFFLPDSSQFYFKGLLEPKYLRYVPNCSHNLFRSEDALEGALAFYQMVVEKKDLPKFTWCQKGFDQLEVSCQDSPIEISLWHAQNKKRRDFRYHEVGPIWKKVPLEILKNKNYLIDLPCPSNGWEASFIELKFSSLQKMPLIFTTDVYVLTKEKKPL